MTTKTILEKMETEPEIMETLSCLLKKINADDFSFYYSDAYDDMEKIICFLDVNFNFNFSISPHQSECDYEWHAITYQPTGNDKKQRTIIWQYEYQEHINFTTPEGIIASLLATHNEIQDNF